MAGQIRFSNKGFGGDAIAATALVQALLAELREAGILSAGGLEAVRNRALASLDPTPNDARNEARVIISTLLSTSDQ